MIDQRDDDIMQYAGQKIGCLNGAEMQGPTRDNSKK